MKEETPKLYEGMYILSAHLTEDAKKKALDRIKDGITKRGGEIKKVHDLEKKKLAYPIAHNKEGHYYLMYFEVKPSTIKELWQDYHLNENLIRFLTLRADEVLEEIKFKELPEQ
jgi:small subunit ribosomal protein S6